MEHFANSLTPLTITTLDTQFSAEYIKTTPVHRLKSLSYYVVIHYINMFSVYLPFWSKLQSPHLTKQTSRVVTLFAGSLVFLGCPLHSLLVFCVMKTMTPSLLSNVPLCLNASSQNKLKVSLPLSLLSPSFPLPTSFLIFHWDTLNSEHFISMALVRVQLG